MPGRLDDLKVQDKILAQIAQGYADQSFVSDQIFKDTVVDRKSDKFPIWGDYRFVDYGDGLLRPLRVDARQKDWTFPTYGTYNCESRALGDRIEDEEIRHSLYKKGILLQRRALILKHFGKKPTDKGTRTWLNTRMKSYKGEK